MLAAGLWKIAAGTQAACGNLSVCKLAVWNASGQGPLFNVRAGVQRLVVLCGAAFAICAGLPLAGKPLVGARKVRRNKKGSFMKIIVDTPEGIAKQAAAIYKELLAVKPIPKRHSV